MTHDNLGCFAFKIGTKDSAKVAMEHFEKCRDICEEIDDAEGVTNVEANIALAKSLCEGGSAESNEEMLKNQQKLYKQLVEELGQEHQFRPSVIL